MALAATSLDWLRMATLCGAGGGLVGAAVGMSATGEGYEVLWLWAGLAAFSISGALWRLFAAGRPEPGILRGVLVGAGAGAASHYVCWYLAILASNICHLATGGCTGSLGDPPIDLLQGVWGAAVLSLASLLLVGPVTVAGGAAAGLLCAWQQRRRSQQE